MLRRIALVYGYHGLRYLMPFLMIAGLSRWLGKFDLAIVLVSQSVAVMAAQIVEYGFGLAGSRDIASTDDRAARATIVSGVLSAQLALAVVAATAAIVLAVSSPILRERLWVCGPILAGAMAVGFGPGWYFQGSDRIRLSVTYEGLGQCLALVLLMAALLARSSVFLCLWALFLGPLAATLLAWNRIRGELRLSIQWRAASVMLRANVALFLSRASITSYTAASTWLMTLLATPLQTATFGAALRVLSGASSIFIPLVQVMLPHVVRARRASTPQFKLHLLGAGLLAAGTFAGGLVYLAAGPVARFVLHNPACAPVLRTLAATLPIIAMSQFFAVYVLVPRRGDRFVAYGTGVGAVVTLGLALVLAADDGAMGMAMARLLGEAAITAVTLLGALHVVGWRPGGFLPLLRRPLRR